jgi:hypothetical protein
VRIVSLTKVVVTQVGSFQQSIKLMEAVHALLVAEGKPASADRIDEARNLLPVVEAEIQEGFPLFHGLAAIGLWSAFEAFAKDLLLDCLENDPAFLKIHSVQKVKVSVARFGAMSEDARHAHILASMAVDIGAEGRPGIAGIERLFREFGLGGSPSDELRACLLELKAVRNALVHRSGVADWRLVQLCPWLGLEPGDAVRISGQMLMMYATSSLVYGTDLTLRLVKHYGLPDRGLTEFVRALEPGVRRTKVP